MVRCIGAAAWKYGRMVPSSPDFFLTARSIKTYRHGTPSPSAATGGAFGIVAGDTDTVNFRYTSRWSGNLLVRVPESGSKKKSEMDVSSGPPAESGCVVDASFHGT